MSTSTWHYLKELAEQLRVNGLPEARVREIVGEVQGHLAVTGEDPVAAFGQPVDYAARWAQLSPRHWISQVMLGAMAALGVACGVKSVFVDGPWTGAVALDESDALQFVVMFGVIGVIPWTVGLVESRRRASRLGESTIPSPWSFRIGVVVLFAIAMGSLGWIVDRRANTAALVELPRWSLVAIALLGLSAVVFMGPTPNSSG